MAASSKRHAASQPASFTFGHHSCLSAVVSVHGLTEHVTRVAAMQAYYRQCMVLASPLGASQARLASLAWQLQVTRTHCANNNWACGAQKCFQNVWVA